jgi:predicted aminopeptidase
MLIVFIRWIRLWLGYVFFLFTMFCAAQFRTSAYLLQQACGQFRILMNKQDVREYVEGNKLVPAARNNLLIVDAIKRFSVDSLGYKPTINYETVFEQNNRPVLWVVTAAPEFSLEPFEWKFPVVGAVSYKGFFDKYRANREFIGLIGEGYDASIRTVTAWSTLGWFGDPLMSNTLLRSRGQFCNLLFHELFHATFYLPGNVNLNENLANFFAHKATLMFLRSDTISVRLYLKQYSEELSYKNFLLRQYRFLKSGYEKTPQQDLPHFKRKALNMISDSIRKTRSGNEKKFRRRANDVLKFKNAYFVDLRQYESLQDSLENAFNKIYRGNIKKMVQDLTTD